MFKKTLLGIMIIYCLGFVFWAPVNMAGISLEWYWMSLWSRKYDEIAHKSLIVPLGRDSIFFQMRYKNLTFWCQLFEHCREN